MLEGKTALITGASRGIGREIALEMAKNGANIALNYVSNSAEAEAVRKLILEENVKCEIYECDVSDFEKSKKMAACVQEIFRG